LIVIPRLALMTTLLSPTIVLFEGAPATRTPALLNIGG
jgi:hypothetical protein